MELWFHHPCITCTVCTVRVLVASLSSIRFEWTISVEILCLDLARTGDTTYASGQHLWSGILKS